MRRRRRHARAARSRPRPSCNLLGATALGFRHRDDVKEISGLLARLGIDVNVVAPLGATPADIARLGDADFNVVLYPEIAAPAAQWLTAHFRPARHQDNPDRRVGAPSRIHQGSRGAGRRRCRAVLSSEMSRLPWYSRSVDSTYLTAKRVFIFGDGTHVLAAARIATDELGFTVVGLGSYGREMAREVARGRDKIRRRGADHRRLSRSRGAHRRIAAGTRARHADGAPHRQAARHSLRGHFGAGACAGFPGALFAADGFRRRQRDFRHLGASADDGPGRTSAGDVPRRPRIPRRRRPFASRHKPGRTESQLAAAPEMQAIAHRTDHRGKARPRPN